MQRRSTLLLPLAVAGSLLMVGSCAIPLTDLDEAEETVPIHVTAFAVGTPISTLVIEVTAEDIHGRLAFNLEVDEKDVAHGVIEVPAGESRTFTVTAYDDHHNVTHTGSETVDVDPGSNPPLHVKLKPVAGEVDVTVTFGDYAVIVTPASETIDASVSTELQLQVTVFDQYDEEVPDPQVQWATTRPTLATVSASGLVTGLADGGVTIVATYSGVAGTSELTLTGFGGAPQTPSWQPQTSGTVKHLHDVWGTSSTDVFAVGEDGVILHYDGSSWTTQVSGTYGFHLMGVWGISSSDVFAVGEYGTIAHYDGTSWTPQGNDAAGILSGVWGTSSTDVFAVGQFGTILHYDGTSWGPDDTGPILINDLWSVWGSSATNVYATEDLGIRARSDLWLLVYHASTILYDLWGTSATDVFAVGGDGAIIHYDGTSWVSHDSPVEGTALRGIWGTSSTDVFAVGDGGTIIHYGY